MRQRISKNEQTSYRTWAWWVAFDGLILTLAPMPGTIGVLGVEPMSVDAADALWLAALALTAIAFVLWNRQGSHGTTPDA